MSKYFLQGHRRGWPPSRRDSKHTQQIGISFIEILIVISILALLVGLAAPSFQGVLAGRRLEGHAAELATDIHHIRSEAVTRNRGLRISFGSDAGGTCYVLHTGDAGDCSCVSSGSAQCSDSNNSLIKSVGLPRHRGVLLQANVSSMLFDPIRGTATPAGSIDLIADSGKVIRQIVNITGRTRTCSPQGSMNGYKVC